MVEWRLAKVGRWAERGGPAFGGRFSSLKTAALARLTGAEGGSGADAAGRGKGLVANWERAKPKAEEEGRGAAAGGGAGALLF